VLLGVWGPRGHDRLAAAARARGLEVIHDGALGLAAPPGSLVEAQTGPWRIWLAGRIDAVDPPLTAAPGTRSPAALAAAALERLGAAGQARLYGAYLLVAHDVRTQTAWVSHDHLGARTLVHTASESGTLFAEEVVDLLSLMPTTPVPDRLALLHWIDRRTLPGDRSLYASVRRLAPGDRLELAASGDAQPRRFWRPVYREPDRTSVEQSAVAVREHAFAAVRRAASGLGQPGVKLSGGLDSACIAAGLVACAEGRTPVALAGLFPDYPEADESLLIEQTARAVGIELVTVVHGATEVFAPVTGYIHRWAVPPWSPMTAVWDPLMAAARSAQIDGLLDGEGGDELFGLTPQLIADRLLSGRLLSAWQLSGQLPGVGTNPSVELRLRVLRNHGVGTALPPRARWLRRRITGSHRNSSPLLFPADASRLLAADEAWAWRRADGPIWWRAAVAGRVHDPHSVDANAELRHAALDAGVEGRHPFLHDAPLVEAMLASPPEQLFDPIRTRPLLRDGLKGIIPEPVRNRFAKSHFTDLISDSMAGPEGAILLSQLADPQAPIRAYVRSRPLDELTAVATASAMDRHRLAGSLFRLASVNSWLFQLEDRE
jgi:asparagine synthase (glutamine-hydrolysing)